MDKGEKSLEDTYLFIEADKFTSPTMKVGGTGLMQGRPTGTEYKWRDLLSLMIIESDNVATNIIMKELSIAYINERAEELGLNSIDVGGILYLEPTAKTQLKVGDVTKVLYLLDCLSKTEREFALKLMEMSNDKNRIARYLKDNYWVGNKSGSVNTTIGDAAIIKNPDTNDTIYLAIFIYNHLGDHVSPNKAEDIIADLSKRIIE